MIRSFKHKGLKKLFFDNDTSGVMAAHVDRLKLILSRLELAERAEDMDLPGYRMHALKGKLKGFWSIRVSGNWRVIYRFENGEASEVDLVDYH